MGLEGEGAWDSFFGGVGEDAPTVQKIERKPKKQKTKKRHTEYPLKLLVATYKVILLHFLKLLKVAKLFDQKFNYYANSRLIIYLDWLVTMDIECTIVSHLPRYIHFSYIWI